MMENVAKAEKIINEAYKVIRDWSQTTQSIDLLFLQRKTEHLRRILIEEIRTIAADTGFKAQNLKSQESGSGRDILVFSSGDDSEISVYLPKQDPVSGVWSILQIPRTGTKSGSPWSVSFDEFNRLIKELSNSLQRGERDADLNLHGKKLINNVLALHYQSKISSS